MNTRAPLLTFICAAFGSALMAQEPPMTKVVIDATPRATPVTATPATFQTVQAGTYFHVSARMTFADLPTQTPAMAKRLAEILKKAGIQTFGPLLVIQRGASPDPAKPFDQEVGILVPPGTKAFGDIKAFGDARVRELPAFSCATTMVNGDFAGEGAKSAFIKLFKAAAEQGRTPTGECREAILFWEGPGSPNNLTQIQIGLQ